MAHSRISTHPHHATGQVSVLETLSLSGYMQKWKAGREILGKMEAKTTLPLGKDFRLWNWMITWETWITDISSFLHCGKLNIMMSLTYKRSWNALWNHQEKNVVYLFFYSSKVSPQMPPLPRGLLYGKEGVYGYIEQTAGNTTGSP